MLEVGLMITQLSFMNGIQVLLILFCTREEHFTVCLDNMTMLVLGTATRSQVVSRHQLLDIGAFCHLKVEKSWMLFCVHPGAPGMGKRFIALCIQKGPHIKWAGTSPSQRSSPPTRYHKSLSYIRHYTKLSTFLHKSYLMFMEYYWAVYHSFLWVRNSARLVSQDTDHKDPTDKTGWETGQTRQKPRWQHKQLLVIFTADYMLMTMD